METTAETELMFPAAVCCGIPRVLTHPPAFRGFPPQQGTARRAYSVDAQLGDSRIFV